MAQAKAQQQAQDAYAQQGKKLASSVQRLRGWVGSDPSRAPELADALIQLTAHRLLGHGYAGAAEDAQDSVRRAAEMLASHGPIGPYTSVSDAARYVTAAVHLAAIQAGLGLPDAAGKTLDTLEDIQEQLGDGLVRQLQPQTAIWALSSNARAALASGDVAAANAWADAALAPTDGVWPRGRRRLAISGDGRRLACLRLPLGSRARRRSPRFSACSQGAV